MIQDGYKIIQIIPAPNNMKANYYLENGEYASMPVVALALIESINYPDERKVKAMSCDDKGNIDFCENDVNFGEISWSES